MFSKFGIGIVLYFKQFKYLMLLTFVMSIFAVPGFVLFIMSTSSGLRLGNPSYKDAISIRGINRKALVKTTFGNMGRGSYACGNGRDGELIHLSCPYSSIEEFLAAGYASPSSTCTSEVLRKAAPIGRRLGARAILRAQQSNFHG